MTAGTKAVTIAALMRFLEEHDALRRGDTVRLIVEVQERGQTRRRLRFRTGQGDTRTFKRSYPLVPTRRR